MFVCSKKLSRIRKMFVNTKNIRDLQKCLWFQKLFGFLKNVHELNNADVFKSCSQF